MTVAPGFTNDRRDESRPSERGHKDVGLGRDRRKVLRTGMTDGHGRMAMKQQQRNGFADDVAATDDDRVFSRNVETAALQQFHDASRRARNELGAILNQTPDV